MNWLRIASILFILSTPAFLLGQSDSLNIEEEYPSEIDVTTKNKRVFPSDSIIHLDHSPGMAALYSIFPGGGQFYNRSYWKIPLIYGSLFIVGDFIVINHREYKKYKAEAISRYQFGDTLAFFDLSDEAVLFYKDEYENRRNLTILIFLGIYLLNIVDATVDAHFFEFDVSPDVTFRAEPYIRQSDYNSTTPIQAGITLSLKL